MLEIFYHEIRYNKDDIAQARRLFADFELNIPDGDDQFYLRPNSDGELDEGVELNDLDEYDAELLAAQLAALRAYGPGPFDGFRSADPSRALWEDMYPLGRFWKRMTGCEPTGIASAAIVRDKHDPRSAAQFIYVALARIGRSFTDEHFREQFAIMCDRLQIVWLQEIKQAGSIA